MLLCIFETGEKPGDRVAVSNAVIDAAIKAPDGYWDDMVAGVSDQVYALPMFVDDPVKRMSRVGYMRLAASLQLLRETFVDSGKAE